MKQLFFLIIILILSIGALKPLMNPYFFPMHDDTQPSRVYEMAKSLSYGQFPVRWVDDLGYGYGYPLFNFYAPLPYYTGSIFNLLGISAISSTKIMFAIGILLSGITMYFLGSFFAGNFAGIAASMLYLYAPYHAVNIFVRGAVGEYYAYAFLPFLILGITILIRSFRDINQTKRAIIIGSLGYAGILLSHNILGLITTYFLLFMLVTYFLILFITGQNKSIIFYFICIILLGFGVSAFFTLPAVIEKNYTKVEELTKGGSEYNKHYLYLDQLWDSPWGFAGSAPGRSDGMSFKIGKIHIIVGVIATFFLYNLWKKRKLHNYLLSIYLFTVVVFLLSVILMTEQSYIIWQLLPGFTFIQYPWRLINFSILSLSLMSSLVFINIKKSSYQGVLAIILIVLTIGFNLKYFIPQLYTNPKEEDYIGNDNLKFKISRISDEYLPSEFIIPQQSINIPIQAIEETDFLKIKKIIKETPTEKVYDIQVFQSQDFLTNVSAFPGWKVYGNDRQLPFSSKEGRINLQLTNGSLILRLKFENTPIRTAANTISLLSIFLLVYVSLFWKKNLPWKKRILLK